jgi:DNA-binding transcriptional regulator YiaG
MTVNRWEKGEEIPPDIPLEPVELTEAEQVFILRRRAGLRVAEAAKKLGISHVTYGRIESGLRPGGDALKLFGA